MTHFTFPKRQDRAKLSATSPIAHFAIALTALMAFLTLSTSQAATTESAAVAAAMVGPKLVEPGTGGFPDPNFLHWKERSFVGNTQYEVVDAGQTKVLKGSADGTASVLYREHSVPVAKTPWVNWSWRVDNTLGPINEQSQAGDDFPARLYVVVRTGFLPWESVAVNYVWSSNTSIDTSWVSPFTEKSVMVAVESGENSLGQWQHERRNVVEDFKEFFDMDIDQIDGYAVMVDADNSGKMATAYFGNIQFTTD